MASCQCLKSNIKPPIMHHLMLYTSCLRVCLDVYRPKFVTAWLIILNYGEALTSC